ncbi:MAG: hypothetical protein AAB674_02435 [Patescibacteria group bacterium]
MKNDIKIIIALITTYTVGNFLLLFNKTLLWDSWGWMPFVEEKNYVSLQNILYQASRYTAYYLYRISGLFDNPLLFTKISAFFSWLLAGLFLYGILRKKLSLKIDRAFFISAFFILTPTFLVRFESSILQCSINIMLFFMAAFIYFIAEKNKNRLVAIVNYSLSWILFFLSFFTYSLLVFYGGFLLLLFVSYRQKNKERPLISGIWPWLKNNFLFIILPIIFWGLKLSIWKSGGYWAGADYDNIGIPTPASLTILLLWSTIIYGFFWQIIAPILILDRKIFALLFIIIGFITYLTTKKIFTERGEGERETDSAQKETDYSSKYYLIAGGILFFLGFLPYFLTGKAPYITFNPSGMRCALLLPVGSSLLVLGTLLLIIRKEWLPLVQTIILTLFMTFTIYNYYGLDMDGYKQIALIENLKSSLNENLKSATTLIFNDKIQGLNWQNRHVFGEEYLGYVQEIYKNNPKFATTDRGLVVNKEGLRIFFVVYPFPEDFNPLEKIVNINITTYDGPEILTVGNWLKIKRLEIFGDQKSFTKKITDIFRIKLEISP